MTHSSPIIPIPFRAPEVQRQPCQPVLQPVCFLPTLAVDRSCSSGSTPFDRALKATTGVLPSQRLLLTGHVPVALLPFMAGSIQSNSLKAATGVLCPTAARASSGLRWHVAKYHTCKMCAKCSPPGPRGVGETLTPAFSDAKNDHHDASGSRVMSMLHKPSSLVTCAAGSQFL